MAERNGLADFPQVSRRLEVKDAVVGVRGFPDMVAVACDDSKLLARLHWGEGLVEMGLRGQTFTGTRVRDESNGAYTLEKYLDDIGHVVKRLSVDAPPTLLGYSHGAYFMTQFALQRSDSARALVLVEPALLSESDRLQKWAELAESGNGVEALEQMLEYVTGGGIDKRKARSEAEGIREAYQSDAALAGEWRVRDEHPVTEEDLGRVEQPVLVVGGSESPFVERLEQIAGAFRNGSLHQVSGANHLTVLSERTEETSQVIHDFLEKTRS
jgi:pimeloyl-ACP methyl ester carboxylesterase